MKRKLMGDRVSELFFFHFHRRYWNHEFGGISFLQLVGIKNSKFFENRYVSPILRNFVIAAYALKIDHFFLGVKFKFIHSRGKKSIDIPRLIEPVSDRKFLIEAYVPTLKFRSARLVLDLFFFFENFNYNIMQLQLVMRMS